MYAIVFMNKEQKEKLSSFFVDIAKAVVIGYGINALVNRGGVGELLIGFVGGILFLLASLFVLKEEVI